jgi:hypothetical protein
VRPGVAPVELALGSSASTAVFLLGMFVYPVGVAMRVGERTRGHGTSRADLEFLDAMRSADGFGRGRRAGRLEWGFEFADGRRVVANDEFPDPGRGTDLATWLPDRPVLRSNGGRMSGYVGDGESWATQDGEYWLWPLPPPGPLRVFCRWPERDIELVEHELDAAPLLEAAKRARPLWPD